MAEVVLEKVNKVFPGNVIAVKDVSLRIADKEFLVLVGPSGCGKSTTLRMIAGLEEITEGTIRIGDRVVNDVAPKDRDIAMVFQNYALYPHKSVYENMAFALRIRRQPKAEIDRRVREAAAILGIEDLFHRRPKALSGGQRQRVALGRAIVRQPKAFLFDEPLSNLDAKLRVEMRAELKKLHQRLQTTMIYVTHDQVEAMTLGDRIVVMNEGEVQQAAAPLAVYDFPANRFVAGFIGTPPMNFFKGRIEQQNGALLFDEGTCRLALPERIGDRLKAYVGKEVTLGIRPEHVKIGGTPSPAAGKMKATVAVVETLGDEMIVHLSTGRNGLISKVDAHQKVRVSEEIEALLDLSKAHVFDPASGRNVTLDGLVT